MRLVRAAITVVILLAGAALVVAILRKAPDGTGGGPADERGRAVDAHEQDETIGAHGGRRFEDGTFAADFALVERSGPPRIQLEVFNDGKPIDPNEVTADVTLGRLGGRTERFALRPEGDTLVGDGGVAEPHSFDVTLEATWRGVSHRWTFPSYEGRVVLSPESAVRAGIAVEAAGPATLATRLRLNGLIVPNEDRLAHVLPRFAGIVKDVRKHIGDPVGKGEVLAIVQSNQSLQSYDVRSEIGGTVIQKHVAPGEFVSEGDHLYTVADLDTVWIDLNVYRQDFPRLAVGQPVVLDAGEGIPALEGRIDYISPFGAPDTQTMLARVVLPNPRHLLRPGLFVSADVLVDRAVVPLAVRASAVQSMRGAEMIFVQDGDRYEAWPVELGRRDGEWVEVLSGITPGQRYAAQGSFVLKADVGKSGASHDH